MLSAETVCMRASTASFSVLMMTRVVLSMLTRSNSVGPQSLAT